MIGDDITNLIRREIGRAMSNMTHPRAGVVSSYDKKTHSVKVTYQPDGNERGWIPIGRHAAGQGISFVHGASPGDQVVIGFLDGDIESGFVSHFLHSDADPAPQVESGETAIVHHGTKTSVMWDKDGHIKITGNGKGVTVTTVDGPVTVSSGSGKIAINGQIHLNEA